MTLRAVKTLESNVVVPGYGPVPNAQTTVNITSDAFNSIPSSMFTNSHLQDMGAVPDGTDAVVTQAAFVAAPAAMTSTDTTSANGVAAAGANPTKAEYDVVVTLVNELKTDHNALRADVSALRGTVAALQTALAGSGKPMAAS